VTQTRTSESAVARLLDDVADAGAEVDLTDVRYRSDEPSETPPYYRFLAGLVRATAARRVVEIGTFHGGATTAMARGVDPSVSGARVVTVDVVALNPEGLDREPLIVQILGDSLSDATVRNVSMQFDDHIDLLYVDSGHDHRQAFENVAIYGNLLKPRIIVIDDIRLNRSMAAMWDHVRAQHPGDVLDVSEVAGRTNVGFGLVVPHYPFRWPEMDAVRRACWRAYWSAGRAVMPRLPGDLAHRVRALVRGQPHTRPARSV
jgi:predicted O-methyltransferase YrrM